MKYHPKLGRALHDKEANTHFSDHVDSETIGYLEETSSELGLASKEAVRRKNTRNKA
ncbi:MULTISPECIES: YrzK family protein [Bacillus]|jgi:hypothetical protein|uniref:YrzK family protein n=1 Tax=Bacillus atrophaeus (strain 1942) TaxID=720555 RepID=A0ABN3ZC38_BACA1|nr:MULTISPECIES: YrzK family protein [Bacillus]ADP33234.1 hypothetical protein BATR1942_11515 [Bacillus atrophaeus 1942]AIK47177.1 hypothetical protein DJ95_2187 [Bacillus atrophaeus subsp. globigii]AKL85984.1 YrzK [Bacillus atrophaeus UCMB-5137]ARW07682.1 uncharacterized protein S101359_02677 [Bacillus atrophaeus]ASS72047.1 hypothetical protein BaGK_14290 [Bacillus atrophaeus]